VVFDEVVRLKENPNLLRLLGHYVEANAADREAWADRVMELPGHDAKELSRWHGELLAFGWVEQNTGVVAAERPGACALCYRSTAAGRRTLQRALAEHDEELQDAA